MPMLSHWHFYFSNERAAQPFSDGWASDHKLKLLPDFSVFRTPDHTIYYGFSIKL
jgi:hypothetical protein